MLAQTFLLKLCLLEYAGRVRAMGFGVNHKDYFQPKKRYTQKERDTLTAQMKHMNGTD